MKKFILLAAGLLILGHSDADAQRRKGKGKGRGATHKGTTGHKAAAKEETAAAGPKLVLKDADTYNFGKVMQGKEVMKEFTFVNTGDQPLIIHNVDAPMGSTTPQWTRHPIVPGGKGFVRVGFSPTKAGPFSKESQIQSNATDGKLHTVCIKGMVTDELAPEPKKR